MDYRLDIFILETSQTIAYTSLVSFVESVPVRILALRYGPFQARTSLAISWSHRKLWANGHQSMRYIGG